MSNAKKNRKQYMTRMLALIIAGVMIVSVVVAAVIGELF